MNIIQELKTILEESSYIDSVNIDYSENTVGNFGLYNTGESVIREFIEGKKEFNANFVLYVFSESYDDIKRISNSDLLINISDYLRQIKNVSITENDTVKGVINGITCSNGMLFNVPGSVNDGYSYQIQIQVNYSIYS